MAIALALLIPVAAQAAIGTVTEVTSDACNGGSGNPTFYSNNRRLAVTPGGRTLAVYDPHGSGVHLKYKEAAGTAWRNDTTGSVSNGDLLAPNDIVNDRTASIDTSGITAWVAWGGYTFSRPSAVWIRRLSNVDAPEGPNVGPPQALVPAGSGNNRVDLAVESDSKGFVSYVRRTPGATTYDLVVGELSSLTTDTPTLVDQQVLYTGGNSNATATFVPMKGGTMRLVARTEKLRLWYRDSSRAAGSQWVMGSAATSAAGKARPSAVFASPGGGSIFVTYEKNLRTGVVKVARFAANGSGVGDFLTTGTGYSQPSIATNGSKLTVVMVNKSSDTIVSRSSSDGSSWSAEQTELTASDPSGGNFAWPNATRSTPDSRLRVLIDGARCPSSQTRNQVIHFERTL